MNIPYRSFTSEGDDPLFLEICEINKFTLSSRRLKSLWRQAIKHFDCLSIFCKEFPDRFSLTDKIDISVPATSFYNLALTRISWRPGAAFPGQLATRHYRLLSNTMSKDEVLAFNAFINAMVQTQKSDPAAPHAAAC